MEAVSGAVCEVLWGSVFFSLFTCDVSNAAKNLYCRSAQLSTGKIGGNRDPQIAPWQTDIDSLFRLAEAR